MCAVDRAGEGWSEPGPAPRSPHQIAGEMYRLLTAAGVAGPYVLVGHSLAGKNVRLFAPRPSATRPPAWCSSTGGATTWTPIPRLPTPRSSSARSGARACCTGPPAESASRDSSARGHGGAMLAATRKAIAILNSRKAAIDATTAEADQRATDDALAAAPSLGDMPLTVLVAGQNAVSDPLWLDAQHRQAALSTNSRFEVVDGSGHYIHWEHPAVVIDAVRRSLPRCGAGRSESRVERP
ncbi:MAG: alpha/beta hydrolase [Anaerolineae bacterium]